ncbi:flagellar biosynthesis/type III secretory pathway protein FliH [Cytobacillus eiseniae]|uniref:Flagellar biosynthesis/type III secretory pathway protein FliH n=1 Tax=Cytobacillus eiseniae TaxID=762947 RepID=A0ABS4RJH4_9BACI|nr:hypothetical protein [Cytobacillus eiseniae]MBP2242933.1 flagellar biosynthesis/type III secretory pathway protein FliH [Cytobacillus eiseniae]
MIEEITKLPKDEEKQVLKLPNSYYERGLEKGNEQGIEQGMIKVERMIFEMVKKGLPENLIADIATYK